MYGNWVGCARLEIKSSFAVAEFGTDFPNSRYVRMYNTHWLLVAHALLWRFSAQFQIWPLIASHCPSRAFWSPNPIKTFEAC